MWKVFYIFTPWTPLFEVFSPMRDWELFFKSVLLYNSIIYFHLLPCNGSMHPAEELRMPALLTLNLIVWYAIAYKILGIRLARNSACAWMVWPDSSHCCLHWKHYICRWGCSSHGNWRIMRSTSWVTLKWTPANLQPSCNRSKKSWFLVISLWGYLLLQQN